MNHYAKFFITMMSLWILTHAGLMYWLGIHQYADGWAVVVNTAYPFVLGAYLLTWAWLDQRHRNRSGRSPSGNPPTKT